MGAGSEKKLNRLSDMEVSEVSAVDRAANKRTFLVTKAEGGVKKVSEKPGAAVVKDGKGGNTASPEKEASLKLAKAAKEELKTRVESVMAGCMELKAALEKAEVAEGAEVPDDIGEKVTGMAEVLLGKEGDALVFKGRKQFSAQRLGALRTAHQQLGELLSEVDGGEGDGGGAGGGSDDAIAGLAAGVEGVQKTLADFKEMFGDAFARVTSAVKKTSDRVGVIEKSRQAPNGAPVDAGDTAPGREEKKKRRVAVPTWGTDLNKMPTDILGGGG